jgi:hypothetical protein
MLDETLVFHKTDLGVAEMESSARVLPPKLRRALILVDGVKSVGDLAPLFRSGEIDASPEQAEGAAIAPEHFEEVRRRAMREISDRLGPNGDTLALKIERCATPEQLRVALIEAGKILESFLGAEYGRTFAQKVGRDLL